MADTKFANPVCAQIERICEVAESKNVKLPANPYSVIYEIATALYSSNGDEQDAINNVSSKFGRNKRSPPSDSNQNNKKTKQASKDEGESSLAPHRTISLLREVREQKAVNSANQKIADAFADYGEDQLEHGHTGKGVSHLRAASSILQHPDAIKSYKDARAVPMVGEKLAAQIEEVLNTGKLRDETSEQNVSSDVNQHQRPELVLEIHNSRANRPGNQHLVDELTKFGEHELYFGNSGKGVSHLRAAREIQLTPTLIKSGSSAVSNVPLVGEVIADKIDQILKHGRIVKDVGETTGSRGRSRGGYTVAPIVKDLRENPAKCSENQPIVDALVDYGESHLYSGHRGKGISHLRAARSIRSAETVVKSGQQAIKDIGMVGRNVAKKIDQILETGHADSDEDYEYDVDEEEDSDYGEEYRESEEPPLVQEIVSKRARMEKNQPLVDALVKYGEKELHKRHTGRGTAFLRAARRLRDADTVVSSGEEAKQLGQIGDKVAEFLSNNFGS